MTRKLSLAFFLINLTALSAFAVSEDIVQRKLNTAPGGKLVVDVDFGSIEISAGKDSEIAIDAERKIDWRDQAEEQKYFTEVPVKIAQQGDTVTVSAHREAGMSGRHGHWHSITDGRYLIRVPKNFNASLQTSGGAISVENVSGEITTNTRGGDLKFTRLNGKLDGKTSGGGIELVDCQGAVQVRTSGGEINGRGGSGELSAYTSGGSAHLRDFAGPAEIETSGGNLNFANIRGRLMGRTSGGSIDATLAVPVAGDVQLETSAGSISITVPENAAVQIDAAASGGNVSSELSLQAAHVTAGGLQATMNGGGPLLKLRSGGGSIHLSSPNSHTASLKR